MAKGEDIALDISFDEKDLAAIGQMANFSTFLDPEVQKSMQSAGEKIANQAKDNTWSVFENPSGKLADTIQVLPVSPYEVHVGSDSPYAARREYGFSGMTDALGRHFTNDPAKPYLRPAMEMMQNDALAMIDDGVAAALAALSSGA